MDGMSRSRLDLRYRLRVEAPFLLATYGEIVSAAFLEPTMIRLRNDAAIHDHGRFCRNRRRFQYFGQGMIFGHLARENFRPASPAVAVPYES